MRLDKKMTKEGPDQHYKPLPHDQVKNNHMFMYQSLQKRSQFHSFIIWSKEVMQVLRSTHHPHKSFSGWLTIAQLTGAPLIYQPKQQNYVQANHQKPPPLFPHPPPSLHHQYSQQQTAYWLQENQVTLAIFTFCTSLSFYPSRQYQSPQFNMYLYITTTLCQFLKIPQDQVGVHLMT